MKTIDIKLSSDSIQKAIEEIQKYKQELRFKMSIFVSRMAEIGLVTIDANKYSRGDSDFNDLHSYIRLNENGATATATLVLAGHDVAFIEFGAGVHYNGAAGSSPHEYGAKLGMTIGSYGLGLGSNDSWHYQKDGVWKTSYGTEAAKPVYMARKEIEEQFLAIAKEVFNA